MTAFRELHHGPAPLVLPNVWDAASARTFAGAGFGALATASAALDEVLGYAAGQTPADEMFAAIRRITRAVDVPVSADVESGYGIAPAELVERILDAGAVGCNLEDSVDHVLKDPEQQADFLAAVREAAGDQLVINARIDVFVALQDKADPADAVARGNRYREAGADCVYPILAPADALPGLVRDIDAPVNAIAVPDGPSIEDLTGMGVTRITFGPVLFRQTMAEATRLAKALR
jgi:2-methylisocitrate lyase-like PEP mutase family enzyme